MKPHQEQWSSVSLEGVDDSELNSDSGDWLTWTSEELKEWSHHSRWWRLKHWFRFHFCVYWSSCLSVVK